RCGGVPSRFLKDSRSRRRRNDALKQSTSHPQKTKGAQKNTLCAPFVFNLRCQILERRFSSNFWAGGLSLTKISRQVGLQILSRNNLQREKTRIRNLLIKQ